VGGECQSKLVIVGERRGNTKGYQLGAKALTVCVSQLRPRNL
jgi:hypothetical protein